MPVEYATALVFRAETTLQPLYDTLARQAILTVRAEPVASFLGNKITPQLAEEIGSRFTTRLAGTGIQHRVGRVLRIETTPNVASCCRHHCQGEHRDGSGHRALHRRTAPQPVDGPTRKGFHFFDRTPQALLRAPQRPEFNRRGIRRADLKPFLPHRSAARITRSWRRRRPFRLIKKWPAAIATPYASRRKNHRRLLPSHRIEPDPRSGMSVCDQKM